MVLLGLAIFVYYNDTTYSIIAKASKVLPFNVRSEYDQFAKNWNIKRKLSQYSYDPKVDAQIILNAQQQILLDSIQTKLLQRKYGDDKVKKWVNVSYILGQDTLLVRLKHFGTSWLHFKEKDHFSFKVKKDSIQLNYILLNEMNALQLFSNNLAFKYGLISPKASIQHFEMNEVQNDMYVEERISKHYMKRHYAMDNYAMIRPYQEKFNKELYIYGDPHISQLDLDYHYQKVKGKKKGKALAAFDKMVNLIGKDDFADYFDKEYMGKYLAFIYLFNDPHRIAGHNLRWIYNHDNRKFYPIYRAESLSRKMKHYHNYAGINSLVFDALPQMKESPSFQIFKSLIANEEIREIRDQFLWEFLKEYNLNEEVEEVYEQYYNQMYNAGIGTRSFEFDLKRLRMEFDIRENLFNDYIEKGSVFVTERNDLTEVVLDKFANLVWYPSFEKTDSINIKGIEIDHKLNFSYPVNELNLSIDSFKNGVLLNSITRDTIDIQQSFMNKYE